MVLALALASLHLLCHLFSLWLLAGEHVPNRVRSDGRIERRKGMAYICNLAVQEAYRKRGVGKFLMEHATRVSSLSLSPLLSLSLEQIVPAGYATN